MFHLRSGDRVVFYGDSITDARMYTTFVETYVLTRFPGLDVRFVHSGWGGDRVTGGGGGRVDVRLTRDVIMHQPTVVTVMLGMNDGRYRPFDQENYDLFVTGYERLIRTLRSELPKARLTVMVPSPYDEITRPPMTGGRYNDVLLRFGDFIRKLAVRERLGFADLHSDLLRVLQKANLEDPTLAAQIIPDRVHPGSGGHLVLAASLLKAWRAPSLVTAVEIDGARGRLLQARNTAVFELDRAEGSLRWSQLDAALPMPIDVNEPVNALAVRSSTVVETLDQQPLKITGLPVGPFALRIDDEQVGVYRGPELARGINLATLLTPMVRQAFEVHWLTLKHNDVHNTRWRYVQMRLDRDSLAHTGPALEALDGMEQELIVRQRATNRPRMRRYELVPVPPVAANVPSGFTPVFGSGDLRFALLGGERHRNVEVFFEMDGSSEGSANLFLRLDSKGHGYRISLDGREGGTFGRIDGPGIDGVKASPVPPWRGSWKAGEWNAVRARIVGDRAQVLVWLNGTRITEWSDRAVHPSEDSGYEEGGFVALELVGAGDARPRFRNVAVKDLP
jgi:lysophospholipase L1-like esterase